MLYLSELSYRAMTYQSVMVEASHVSLLVGSRDERGHAEIPAKGEERRSDRRDEAEVLGREIFVRAAIDTDTRELIAACTSCYRSSIDALVFFERLIGTCTDRTAVLVDGGPGASRPWASTA
jgi:transposase-like protein